LDVLSFTGGPFAENGYLAICPETGKAVVIDPGACAPDIVAAIEERGADVERILLTHAHLDHVEGIPRVLEAVSAPIHLHAADRALYDAAPDQARAFGLTPPDLPPPDAGLEHGQRIEVGSFALRVRHAPGHAPGHVIFVEDSEGVAGEGSGSSRVEHAGDEDAWEGDAGEGASVAFVADVIFRGSIGRTDLPGGSLKELMESIREQVLTLPNDTRLLTGHGPETTVQWERETNPFVKPHYGGTFA